MIKKFIAGTVALSALAMAMPASAKVYELTMADSSKITINTTTMIGTWIGTAINATFSGAGLANFSTGAGGALDIPSFGTDVTIDPSSNLNIGGRIYNITPATPGHAQMFEAGAVAGGKNVVNLWAVWSNATCYCTYGDFVNTVTGARSYGEPSPVPEPGVIGLMGLGVMGMAFARRRRAKVSLNMAPLAA